LHVVCTFTILKSFIYSNGVSSSKSIWLISFQ
jgi:hypothetical protein